MNERTTKSAAFLSAQDIHTEWESDYLNAHLDPFYEEAFQTIAAHLGAAPGDRILDAGCGYCYHAARFARQGLQVTGVDFSPSALEAAERNLERMGVADRVELRQGDLLQLPFEDGAFPFVSCWGVLMHIPDLERALLELSRVCKPGGRIAIAENNAQSLHVRAWEPLLRTVKKGLGRQTFPVERKACGVEEWRDQGGGGLMVRKLDPEFLIRFYQDRGHRLVSRFAAQFTEAYTTMPLRILKRAVYRFNHFYFRRMRHPTLAMGNIFIFEKNA